MGAIAAIVQRLGINRGSLMKNKRGRLSVEEMIAIDPRRRVAIIRCDDAQHLVMISPNSETVIAQNIQAQHIYEQKEAA